MDREALLEKLADILDVDKNKLNEEFELNTENWDSLAIIDVIALIDEQFDVTVPAEDLKECTSVEALLQLIYRSVL